ncbi:hypothetical protein HDU79_001232 [Rhizoclosmatium sp. JEL0117]|nr:hypothetical protein HDU79_001232 [Rhizoclosmatium sp. JEL0117]
MKVRTTVSGTGDEEEGATPTTTTGIKRRLLGVPPIALVLIPLLCVYVLVTSLQTTSPRSIHSLLPNIDLPVDTLLRLRRSPKKPDLFDTHLDVNFLGCPTKKTALIGVFANPDFAYTARRQYLRQKYKDLNAGLPEKDRLDFVFVFGDGATYEQRYQVQMEMDEHQEDTIITDRIVDNNDGKVYDWFKYAGNIMYTPHPVIPSKWCLRYEYIGKANDDSMINVASLSQLLRKLPKKQQYIGQMDADRDSMDGMLYLVTPDIVEWLAFAIIPEERMVGREDHVFADFVRDSRINVNYIDMKHKVFDTRNDRWVVSPHTVVMHPCKSMEMFFRCMMMFDVVDRNHELLADQDLFTDRLLQLGLDLAPPIVNKTITEVRLELSKRGPTIMSIVNDMMLWYAITFQAEELGTHLTQEDKTRLIEICFWELERDKNGRVKSVYGKGRFEELFRLTWKSR